MQERPDAPKRWTLLGAQVMDGGNAVGRWLANPVLLEWEQSVAWCDLAAERELESWRSLSRQLLRAFVLGTFTLVAGVFLLSRIPGAGEPPWRLILLAAGVVLLPLLLPAVGLRLGFLLPRRGVAVGVKLRQRWLELAGKGGSKRVQVWRTFEAFDFGMSDGFQVLRLRRRPTGAVGPARKRLIHSLEIGAAGIELHVVREILTGRGLHEEPLGEPQG